MTTPQFLPDDIHTLIATLQKISDLIAEAGGARP